MKKVVIDRKFTFLWHDNWHSLGPYLEKYGNKVIYDSSILEEVKGDLIIHKGN